MGFPLGYGSLKVENFRFGMFFDSLNVPDEESPLASGMAPARAAESAGGMPEVPKGRGFAPSVCSISSFHSRGKSIKIGEFRSAVGKTGKQNDCGLPFLVVTLT